MTISHLGEVLLESKVIDKNSISDIETLFKSSVSFLSKDLKYSSDKMTEDATVKNLAIDLIKAAYEKAKIDPKILFSKAHENKINKIIDKYRKLLRTIKRTHEILGDYDKSYRKLLLQNILTKCEPLRDVRSVSMREFCKLVFLKDWSSLKESFLKAPKSNKRERPYLHPVFRIIDSAYGWTPDHFAKLGIQVTYDELKAMRITIREEVFSWIIKGRYSPALYHQKLLRQDDPISPELMLAFALWSSSAHYQDDPYLSFRGITKAKLLGYATDLTVNLRVGNGYSRITVTKFKNTLQTWIIQEGKKPNKDMQKLRLYQSTLKVIAFYAQIRGLDLKGGVKAKFPSTRGAFNYEQTSIYHVVLGIGRHLGFDPGFFRPIEDDMFNMNDQKRSIFRLLGKKLYVFIRHHFRDNPDRASILLHDNFLIDTRSHYYWEKLISEDDALVCSQVLENLIKYSGNINENDIMNEFQNFGDKYLWLAENWIEDRHFSKNLDIFNERKNDIKTMRLNEFIKTHYPIAYARFYNTLMKKRRVSLRGIIESLHPNIDVTELINLGKNDDHIGPYTRVFTEILRLFNYPVYY